MTSQQQCLGTYRLRNSGFTFALAQVKDGINRNPIAAQEACYYGCGAQIVTQSSNRGDMYHLTLMDSAASALRASGVLKIGESYLLNHLGMRTEEGGNGIGCMQISQSAFNHYPKEHGVCAQAKVAVCGFWGQQTIPTKPGSNPVPTATVTSSKSKTSTSSTRPASSSTAQVFSSTTSSKADTPTPVTPPLQSGTIHHFDANGTKYHVIKKQTGESNSLVLAKSVCYQTLGSVVGRITSIGYEAVISQLQKSPFASSKVIIGSWNGDSYSLSGDNCLILQVNSGIYPGRCSEASAILCQS